MLDFNNYREQISALSRQCVSSTSINPELYTKYDVKRGLRDLNGNGVLTGLTEISEINSAVYINGVKTACEGSLYFRGYNIKDLVSGAMTSAHSGFEETAYLLLFGRLPTRDELQSFRTLLADMRKLPGSFVRDVVMKAANPDIMNSVSKSVLTLYSYDENANDLAVDNVLRQCLHLISVFPMLCVYGYHAYNYYKNGRSLFFHAPERELSVSENVLHMLRPDSSFTELEASVLDACLMLHAEHGGGNNSTFTMHVVTSSGTDTYSAVSAALGSLKGPKHGGANIKVVRMFDDIKANVRDWYDEDEVTAYLDRILSKQAFDNTGLIYGMGHAVYSLSDPRADVLKGFVERLSTEKGLGEEFGLYSLVERLAADLICKKRKIYKGVSANVDFYSGFAYRMLGIPDELFTPLFAISRIAGWSAHRLEEILSGSKIIRPAYMSVSDHRKYIPMDER